jgi:chromosomal replication initiation ATPase DnaA
MPEITYQILQKPIEERILDAASIYWDVPRTYFAKTKFKDETTIVYRRRVVFSLLKQNTVYSFKEIASKFGFLSTSRVIEGVEEIEVQKRIYRQICEDINQIQFLADKLDCDFITTTIQLSQKNITSNGK